MHTKPTSRTRGILAWLRQSVTGRFLLSLIAVSVITTITMTVTQATLADQVTMAQVSVTGGTLDMVANADTSDSGVEWSGALSVALTGMAPGDERSGTVEIENTGDLPYTLQVSTTGVDADSCFSYYFRETSVTGGTGAAAHPVNIANMGTAAGADGTTAAFASAVSGSSMPDNGVDINWEAGDRKVYTLTVRARTGCVSNGATGTLDINFDAVQV